MADYNSSLPVRTENAGDVIAKIADATTPSQQLAISAAGEASVQVTQPLPAGTNLIGKATISQGGNDATVTASNALKVDGSAVTQPVSGTVTANQGTSPWITKDQADGPVAPGTVASFSQLAGGQYNATPPTLTDTQQVALQVDSSGKLLTTASFSGSVTVSNFPDPVDTNYGTVGASTIRTAAEIGNATGAASFNYGAVGAQTLRSAAQVGNATGAADFNAGATGAQTLRVEANQGASATAANGWYVKPTDGTNSQSYTAAGAAKTDIEQIAGAAPSATNALPVQITTSNAFVSSSNPLPVIIDPAGAGTTVCDYKDAASIAAGASDNHDYTVTAGKTLHLRQVESSASGKAKMLLAVETGVATGTFTTKAVQFNSTATADMSLILQSDILVAAGVRVRVTMTNRDNQAQDLYSSIIGFEI